MTLPRNPIQYLWCRWEKVPPQTKGRTLISPQEVSPPSKVELCVETSPLDQLHVPLTYIDTNILYKGYEHASKIRI